MVVIVHEVFGVKEMEGRVFNKLDDPDEANEGPGYSKVNRFHTMEMQAYR